MKRVRFTPSPTGSLAVDNAPVDNAVTALTLTRFRELRERTNDSLDYDSAKSLVRELKAVGGDLHAVRVALTGRDRGQALAAVIAALDADETMLRLDAAV